MSLIDSLTSLTPDDFRPGPKCAVGQTMDQLEPAEAAALLAAIDNHSLPISLIVQALIDHGHRVSYRSAMRHRRRGQAEGCRCK